MTNDLYDDGLTFPTTCPYALTDVRAHLTVDGGMAFDATLTLDGTPFATVAQDGRGGCDLLRPTKPGNRDLIDAYRTYARDLLEPQGVVYEPEDLMTAELLDRWARQPRTY